jgi:hypothetical protein
MLQATEQQSVKDRDDCIRFAQHRDETLQKLGQVEKDRDNALQRCEQIRGEYNQYQSRVARHDTESSPSASSRRVSFTDPTPMKSSDFDVSPVQQRGDTPDSGVCRTSREHHDKILKANGCINEEAHNRKVDEQWTDLRRKHGEQFQQILHKLSEELTTEDSSERKVLRRIEASVWDKFIEFNRNIDPQQAVEEFSKRPSTGLSVPSLLSHL